MLEHVGVNPHPGEIGNHVELGHGRHVLTLAGPDLQDHAFSRRVNVQRLLRDAGFFQLDDLMLRHIQQLEPGTGTRDEIGRAAADVGNGAVVERLVVPERKHVFLLAGHQARRVHAQQHGVLTDLSTGGVHVHFLDPTFDLGVQPGNTPLVEVDTA